MKTKRTIILMLICSLALIVRCSKQPYYDIPLDSNGKAIVTTVSTTTSAGISILDNSFTVNATLPNAKAGDKMIAELLQLQIPSWGGIATQLLPLAGTQKELTVDANLAVSVSYTRTEAKLVNIGDYVTVTLSGATESGLVKVTLVSALTVDVPKFSGKTVTLMRIPDIATVGVTVAPKSGAYTGNVVVTKKLGVNGAYTAVGSYPVPASVPISGNDFVGNDTMYYRYVVTQNSYSQESVVKYIVQTPSFFLNKTAVTLTAGGSSAGRNLLTNAAVAATNAASTISLTLSGGVLSVQGGSAWLAAGKTIQFVPTTSAKYTANASLVAIADFAAGTPVTTFDPSIAPGIYIFKIVDGANTYYGMIKVTAIVPGVSATIEYRIGDKYSHLLTIS